MEIKEYVLIETDTGGYFVNKVDGVVELCPQPYYARSNKNSDAVRKWIEKYDLKGFEVVEYEF
jgi:hypothetical protein